MQRAELLLGHRRRAPVHGARTAVRLGEGDDVTDGGTPGHHHDDAIDAERDSPVRRRPVFEGLEEEPEAFLRLVV